MTLNEAFNDSYERCKKNDDFFNVFYSIFFEENNRFRQMFVDVDMKHQIRMVKASVVLILLAPTSDAAQTTLRIHARKHGPNGMNVHPQDFDIWFKCLLDAVSVCDPLYNAQVREAWEACFHKGLAIMKEECCTNDLP